MVKKKIFKSKDSLENHYQSLIRIVPFSIIIIFLFSVMPISFNYLKENFKSNKIIINASKQNFDETFKKKN